MGKMPWQSIVVLALIFPVTASATPGIMKRFIARYSLDDDSQLASCRTCHMPIVKDCLNPFAIALRDNGLDFGAIEGGDADEDGVSNIEEIRAMQLPGSQAQPDEVFVFTNRIGAITFNHEKHSLAKEYRSEGKCSNCHSPEKFPRRFDDNVSWQNVAHQLCKGCHKESGSKVAPQSCFKCHDRNIVPSE